MEGVLVDNLYLRIKAIYPDLEPPDDYRLEDGGSGAVIAEWHATETQPTQAQLKAVTLEAETARQNSLVIAQRSSEYVREFDKGGGHDALGAMGYLLDAIMEDYQAVRTALESGDPVPAMTTELASFYTKRAGVKARNPKL